MINEVMRGEGKKARTAYLVDYTMDKTSDEFLIFAFMLVSRLDRKVEINCENKTIECMLLSDAEKVEELVNGSTRTNS